LINISKLYCGLASDSDRLRYDADRPARPIAVYNCTARCNLKCVHCYSGSNQASGEYELSRAEAGKLLRDLADYKCPVVLFSGGEPLLRGDVYELIAEAKELGLRTVLSTNGTLIDEQAAGKLRDVGISYVGISLDGPEQAHDLFRGVRGSFSATMNGIRNCRTAGVKTGLRFTITRQNHEYVRDVFRIAKEMGVRRICFYHLVRTGRGAGLDNEYLAAQQIRTAMDDIIDGTKKAVEAGLIDEVLTVGNHADGPYLLLRMNREKHPGYESAKELLTAAGGNKSGQNIACIGWDGTVFADQFWREYPLGNVRRQSFGAIWDNPTEPVLAKLRDKDNFVHPRCKACRWFKFCKGNYRFLGGDPAIENWVLEPPCYLGEEEIRG
jgi:radical SAM protein with 4Fe4S-binding SPASM domain